MSNNSEFCSKLCGKDCKVSLLHAKEIQGVTNKEYIDEGICVEQKPFPSCEVSGF